MDVGEADVQGTATVQGHDWLLQSMTSVKPRHGHSVGCTLDVQLSPSLCRATGAGRGSGSRITRQLGRCLAAE